MDRDVTEKIVSAYVNQVLTPELGGGELQKRLVTGLERIMDSVTVSLTFSNDKDSAYKSSPLTDYGQEIDYQNIVRIFSDVSGATFPAAKGTASRLKHVLSLELGINTYSDLVRLYREGVEGDSRSGIPPSESMEEFRGNLYRRRGIGIKTIGTFIHHLKEIGFDPSTQQ